MTMITELTLTVLSSLGLLISLYFLLVYHKLILPNASYIPTFCRLDERTCETILHTPYARLLGVQNFYPGIIFYILVIVFGSDPNALHTLVGLSGVTVLAGIYLSYSLLYKLKVPCVLCFTGHGINFFIFILLLSSLR